MIHYEKNNYQFSDCRDSDSALPFMHKAREYPKRVPESY